MWNLLLNLFQEVKKISEVHWNTLLKVLGYSLSTLAADGIARQERQHRSQALPITFERVSYGVVKAGRPARQSDRIDIVVYEGLVCLDFFRLARQITHPSNFIKMKTSLGDGYIPNMTNRRHCRVPFPFSTGTRPSIGRGKFGLQNNQPRFRSQEKVWNTLERQVSGGGYRPDILLCARLTFSSIFASEVHAHCVHTGFSLDFTLLAAYIGHAIIKNEIFS
jgi:hypothetical protein